MPEVVQVFDDRTVDTPAVRFRYAVAGAGPPVVLVPGGGGWKPTFLHMITALSARHRVVAVDPQAKAARPPSARRSATTRTRSHPRSATSWTPSGCGQPPSSGTRGAAATRSGSPQLQPERVSALALLAPGGLDVADL